MSEPAEDLSCVVVRPAVSGDLAYVVDMWARKLPGYQPDLRRLRDCEMRELARARVTRALAREGVCVRVACYSGDPSWLSGWIVDRGDCLLYAYVRAPYRGRGILRLLVGDSRYERAACRCRVLPRCRGEEP